jgi:hypothetical protein
MVASRKLISQSYNSSDIITISYSISGAIPVQQNEWMDGDGLLSA